MQEIYGHAHSFLAQLAFVRAEGLQHSRQVLPSWPSRYWQVANLRPRWLTSAFSSDMAADAKIPKEYLVSVEQGADTGVWLVRLPACFAMSTDSCVALQATEQAKTSETGPRGGFFSERKPMAF